MANITEKTSIGGTPADGDKMYIVDVSDTTDNANGSDKHVLISDLKNIVPAADATTSGTVELATTAETTTGTDTTRAVTPDGLKDGFQGSANIDTLGTVTTGTWGATAIEGTAIASTGEAGGSKFLREDGDGTSSWQAIPGGGDLLAANNLSDVSDAATSLSNLGGLANVVEDTTPQLGGELDAQGNNIVDLADVTFKTGVTGGTIRTGATAADKFVLQAYDTGVGYQNVLQADAGADPTLEVFDNSFQIQNYTDQTKKITVDASGITTGTTRSVTMPDADVDLTNTPTAAEKTVLGNTSGTNTGDEAAASTTTAGISELATTAEVDTGTDATRAITPDSLNGSSPAVVTTNMTEGTDKNFVTDAEATVIGNTSGTNTGDEAAASTTTAGVVELATTTETTTGTDTARAVTPDGLHDMTSLSGAAWVLDEDDMVSDSNTKVATQQSIKAYVDASAGGGGGQTLYDAVLAPSGGDYTDLSTALAALSAGETLFVRSGTYTETTLTFSTANVNIIGENKKTTILKFSDTTNFTFSGAGLTLENLTIQVDNSAGMLFSGDDFTMTNCNYEASASAARYAFRTTGANCVITDNFFEDTVTSEDSARYWLQGSNSSYTGNIWQITNGSDLTTEGVIHLGTITSNEFSGNTIHLANQAVSGGVLVSGANIRNNTLTGDTSDSVLIRLVADGLAVGNYLDSYDVGIEGTDTNVVSSNFLSGAATSHITLGRASSCAGNTINGSGTGITIDSNKDGVAVTGNAMRSCTTGVSVSSGSDNSVVIGNSFWGCTTAITDNGTNTIYQTATDSDPLNGIFTL